MLESFAVEKVFYDLMLAIISAIVVVPIVFLINDYLTFNQYLRLLTKEIKENLELIDNLPMWLEKVRRRERAWLPGINSNQPQPGYVLKYLSMNNYNNFLNQKYWIYLDRGAADKLSELYEFTRRYCDIIHRLETVYDDQQPHIGIMRDENQQVLDINYYSEIRFQSRLGITPNMIRHHASALDLDHINSFKDRQWWYPNWLKSLLSD
jgi:hypothetical protein